MERYGDKSSKIETEFQVWLSKNIDKIFTDQEIQKVVTEKLAAVNSEIRWEVGPWSEHMNFFAFSPNLNDDLYVVTERLAAGALPNEKWIFLSSKPRKKWKSRVIQIRESNSKCTEYKLDNWQYYLTSFNQGEFFDINFIPYGYEDSPIKELEYVGSLLSEFELGEELFMNLIDRINIILPAQLKTPSNKLDNLYDQILSLTE